MINLIGAIGAFCFAISAIPLAYDTYRLGRSEVSLLGILLIIIGAGSMFFYELGTSAKIFSLVDFAICTLCWIIILKYRLLPRLK